jgi:DNA-binding response OmpR family regulator
MADAVQVLFVDDEQSIRLTLPPLLASFGFEVTSAATVSEAVTLITQRKFDVLIADLNVGNPADGFTVVSAMRRIQPEAVTLILTGYPAFESALEALRQQVDDYIAKPADPQQLVPTIRAGLQRRRLAAPLPAQRVPDVIRENRELITNRWLETIKQDPELNALPLSEAQRRDHVPKVLDAATRDPGKTQKSLEDTRAARLHGSTRRKQGYTIPMLMREARLLQMAAIEFVQRSLLSINLSYLVPDLIRLLAAMGSFLEESARAFIEEVPSTKYPAPLRKSKPSHNMRSTKVKRHGT